MFKNFPILLLICVSFVNLFDTTFGNFCDSNSVVNQAINLGTNIYLGQGSGSIWKFNPDVRRTIDRKLDLQTIFGENSFDWIDTAFTFVFDECDSMTRTDSYCEATNEAKDLVIAIGRRKNAGRSRKYGYVAYRVNQDSASYSHELIPINDTDNFIAWDLRSMGGLYGNFWVPKSGDLYYESSVFVKSRNELIVSVFDTSTFSSDAIHLMSRKLEDDGLWSSKWTEIARTGFRGMFEINGRVFGFDKKNNVFEFKWSDDRSISFESISNLKELLNCFGNSSLWEKNEEIPVLWDPLDNSTSSPSTTSTSSSSSTSTESSSSSTTFGSVDEKEEENEIQAKSETINYETIGPEVALLTNLTESSTVAEPQMNQKLEETPGNDNGQEDSTDWSAVFVVAILLLIIVIVIALIIIVRNKSKSRIVYLNNKSDDSKSAEIPLNNNDNSLHTKDV